MTGSSCFSGAGKLPVLGNQRPHGRELFYLVLYVFLDFGLGSFSVASDVLLLVIGGSSAA